MKIVHFSDLHSDFEILKDIEKPDLWICTGDFMPNFTNPAMEKNKRLRIEREEQGQWFHDNMSKINEYLRDVPIFWTGGNHDFIKPFGLNKLTYFHEGIYAEFQGLRFAGFPEIPSLNGYWSGEVGTQEMLRICQSVFSQPFDVLLTHSPPRDILDNVSYWGVESVGSLPIKYSVMNSEIKLHCFGHIHEQGGKQVVIENKIFSNAATVFNTIEL